MKIAIVSDIPAHIYLKIFVATFNKSFIFSNRALKQVKRLPPNKLEFTKAITSMNRMTKEYHKYYEDLISD